MVTFRIDWNLWTNNYWLSWWDVYAWNCWRSYAIQWASLGGGSRDGLQSAWGSSMWRNMCERKDCFYWILQRPWTNQRGNKGWLVSYRWFITSLSCSCLKIHCHLTCFFTISFFYYFRRHRRNLSKWGCEDHWQEEESHKTIPRRIHSTWTLRKRLLGYPDRRGCKFRHLPFDFLSEAKFIVLVIWVSLIYSFHRYGSMGTASNQCWLQWWFYMRRTPRNGQIQMVFCVLFLSFVLLNSSDIMFSLSSLPRLKGTRYYIFLKQLKPRLYFGVE